MSARGVRRGDASKMGPEAQRPVTQYLTFQVGGESYGIEISRVREILQYEIVTRVPAAPPSVRGVMDLRGSVVPVVDLGVKFGLPTSEVTKRTCVIISEVLWGHDRTTVGLMVDSVREVFELRDADALPPPTLGASVQVEYLARMARYGKKFLLLLDIDRILSAEDLEVAARIEEAVRQLQAEEAARAGARGDAPPGDAVGDLLRGLKPRGPRGEERERPSEKGGGVSE